MEQLKANSDIVHAVSFGAFSVAAASGMSAPTLAGSVNATLQSELSALGFETHALVGCGSTPTLRQLFANPEPFITAAVQATVASNVTGLNLDFEPYDNQATNADGLAFAAFVDRLANSLHAAGKVLSVDYFTNNAFWSLAALNGTAVDRLISMDTYVQGNETFEVYMAVANAYAEGSRLGVGMCSQVSKAGTPFGPDPCGSEVWTDEMLKERFAFLATASAGGLLSQINMWVLPLPDNWWAALRAFLG